MRRLRVARVSAPGCRCASAAPLRPNDLRPPLSPHHISGVDHELRLAIEGGVAELGVGRGEEQQVVAAEQTSPARSGRDPLDLFDGRGAREDLQPAVFAKRAHTGDMGLSAEVVGAGVIQDQPADVSVDGK